MKKNQKGFSTVEGLLIAIIVLLIGFVGYYVYHSTKNANSTYNAASSTNSSTSTTTNPYAGWKSYSDDFVSLKYPGTWAVVRDDNTSLPGTKQLDLRGPDDKTIAKSTDIETSHKASLVLTIFQNSQPGQVLCNCKVFDLKTVNIKQVPKAKLAVTSTMQLGGDPTTPPASIIVTPDSSIQIGVTKVGTYVTVGSKAEGIWADVADNGATGGRISNLSQFEQSQSFKDLIKILDSLSFK